MEVISSLTTTMIHKTARAENIYRQNRLTNEQQTDHMKGNNSNKTVQELKL